MIGNKPSPVPAPEAPPSELRGVVLPTGNADLLLPNAAVAEVVGYKEPAPFANAPLWLLGGVPWRGCSVPLISIAMANAVPGDVAHGQRGRMVICYTPSGNRALPYIAIFAVGPPRLARLNPQSLQPAEGLPDNPFVLQGLMFAERPAWIPDMDAIERALVETMGAQPLPSA